MTPNPLSWTGRRRAVAAAVACLALVVSACGTRLSDSQIASGAEHTVAGSAVANNVAAGNNPVANNPAAVGTAAVAGPTAGATLAAGGSTPTAGATAAAGGTGTTAAAAHGGATGGSQPASTTQSCSSQGAPLVIGQDGAFSGLVGQSTSNIRTGLSVWAKYINSVGGVACHPVQLYQEDDNSDPSKASANITDLVRNKHAVALVGTDVPIVVAAARSTADQLGVPMVGGDLTATDWTQDPNMYPSGGSALAVYSGAVGQAIHDTGKSKVGLVYCVEASICGVIHDNYNAMVGSVHGSVVFQQSASLTQSSFTAECQNAKSAGTDILFLALDGSADQRFASSCASIGYHPALATAGIAASPNAFNDSNIKTDGLYIGTNEAPFVANSSPALQTFQNAFHQFYGGNPPDQSAMKGWASGMLLAAAVNALGASARSGAITPAMITQGLHALHNETLGGLLPPMNYPAGQPSPLVNCYSTIKVTGSGVVAPNGAKFTCF
jgi:branched-chain amino acid transport system substrate-binding protein